MSLGSIDKKLFAFYALESFDDNSLSIDARDMYLLPFDASRYDESNELCFIFLRSLDGEPLRYNVLELSPFV